MKRWEETLKLYFEPVRALLNKVYATYDGWTPCPHHAECIGWCPDCLQIKHQLARLNDVYGEPQIPDRS